MSKNSQFEECSTVHLDINGSLAGISDFGKDLVSEAGSASGGISSHDGSKNGTDSDYITQPSIISANSSSFNRKKLYLYFIQEIVIVKLIIIIKWLGTIFEKNISAIPRIQQCSINIVSLNEHMALNLNEYMFLKLTYFLEWI